MSAPEEKPEPVAPAGSPNWFNAPKVDLLQHHSDTAEAGGSVRVNIDLFPVAFRDVIRRLYTVVCALLFPLALADDPSPGNPASDVR